MPAFFSYFSTTTTTKSDKNLNKTAPIYGTSPSQSPSTQKSDHYKILINQKTTDLSEDKVNSGYDNYSQNYSKINFLTNKGRKLPSRAKINYDICDSEWIVYMKVIDLGIFDEALYHSHHDRAITYENLHREPLPKVVKLETPVLKKGSSSDKKQERLNSLPTNLLEEPQNKMEDSSMSAGYGDLGEEFVPMSKQAPVQRHRSNSQDTITRRSSMALSS